MAIFVFFGWMIQLGEKLGLIETESQDPQHQAYRRSVMGMEALKTELQGCQVLRAATNRLETTSGKVLEVDARGNLLRDGQVLCELGVGGKLRFVKEKGFLRIKVRGALGEARHWSDLRVPMSSS